VEFGLGEALPLCAGGLGILAGDFLKTASDLGLPVIGIGLLYQEAYFRQIIDASGEQQEVYPFNDPGSMPIPPAKGQDEAWLHITLDLPGRTLRLRVWQALVGRVRLYLLDANDPLNSPADRGITWKLYDAATEIRLFAAPEEVAVQLYAEPRDGEGPFLGELWPALSDAHIYTGVAPANRPPEDDTVRIIPRREGVVVPTELPLIL
jgi:hypothetical protein